jgi:hypothetical protein
MTPSPIFRWGNWGPERTKICPGHTARGPVAAEGSSNLGFPTLISMPVPHDTLLERHSTSWTYPSLKLRAGHCHKYLENTTRDKKSIPGTRKWLVFMYKLEQISSTVSTWFPTGLKINRQTSQAWWHMPVILSLRRLSQEDLEFQASLGSIQRPCLKNKNKQTTTKTPENGGVNSQWEYHHIHTLSWQGSGWGEEVRVKDLAKSEGRRQRIREEKDKGKGTEGQAQARLWNKWVNKVENWWHTVHG